MKRILQESYVSAYLIANHSRAMDNVISEMMVSMAAKMHKEGLLTISKTSGLPNPMYNNADEVKMSVSCFCMHEEEFNECIKLLLVIKDVVPVEYSEYVERLRKLLTE